MHPNLRTSILALLFFVGALCAASAAQNEHRRKNPRAERVARRLKLGSRLSASLMLNGGFPFTWTRAAGGTAPPRYLKWPLPGHRLGRGFGSDNGKHLAVDVTARVGTPVRAMAKGLVGYADNGVRGYGNMVMILHSGGWVTLYAHLDKFRVQPGQKVERSEIVALSGNTGMSRGPHLHFALIVRGQPTDPIPFMRGIPHDAPRLSYLDKGLPMALRNFLEPQKLICSGRES